MAGALVIIQPQLDQEVLEGGGASFNFLSPNGAKTTGAFGANGGGDHGGNGGNPPLGCRALEREEGGGSGDATTSTPGGNGVIGGFGVVAAGGAGQTGGSGGTGGAFGGNGQTAPSMGQGAGLGGALFVSESGTATLVLQQIHKSFFG